jgi:hypothetical protein
MATREFPSSFNGRTANFRAGLPTSRLWRPVLSSESDLLQSRFGQHHMDAFVQVDELRDVQDVAAKDRLLLNN